VTQADIDEALYDNINNESNNASSSSSASSSGKTVRAVDPKTSSMETFATAPSVQTAGTSSTIPIRRADGPGSPSTKSPDISTHAPSSESSLIRLPVQQSPKSTRSSPETFNIHFTKPPGTALMHLRFEMEELQQVLGLEDDAVSHSFFPSRNKAADATC